MRHDVFHGQVTWDSNGTRHGVMTRDDQKATAILVAILPKQESCHDWGC